MNAKSSVMALRHEGSGERVLRVSMADRHPLVGEWLESRGRSLGIRVACHSQIDDAVAWTREHGVRLLVLEPESPGIDAFAATSEARRDWPATHVMFLCARVRSSVLRSALDAGATAFFGKVDDPGSIVRGLRAAAEGRYAFGASALALCPQLSRLEGAAHTRFGRKVRVESCCATLTPREREVLRLMARGLQRTQVAERLHRSPKTVDKHRASLMRKLGARDRAQLVLIAVREGLAPG